MKPLKFTSEEKTKLLEWAEELEHTSLPQGLTFLRTDRGFCCLGIYCNMRDPEGWSIFGAKIWSFGGFIQTLPHDAAEELGLSPQWGVQQFAIINDMFRYDFPTIAKEIRSLVATGVFSEETQERLFV